jgi:hypothetical protein
LGYRVAAGGGQLPRTEIVAFFEETENYSEYLKRRFPRDERPMLPATDKAREAMGLLTFRRRALEDAEKKEAEVVNYFKVIIGDAGGIEGLCTWRQNKPSTVTDWKAVALEFGLDRRPDIVAKHTTTKPGARPFLLVKEK